MTATRAPRRLSPWQKGLAAEWRPFALKHAARLRRVYAYERLIDLDTAESAAHDGLMLWAAWLRPELIPAPDCLPLNALVAAVNTKVRRLAGVEVRKPGGLTGLIGNPNKPRRATLAFDPKGREDEGPSEIVGLVLGRVPARARVQLEAWLGGETHEEIAAREGVTRGAVQMRVSAAVKKAARPLKIEP